MSYRTMVRSGAGKAGHCVSLSLDNDSRIDVDQCPNGSLTVWLGNPLAGNIHTDLAGLERLHAVLGQALAELHRCDQTTNADSSTESNATVSPAVESTAPSA